MKNVCIILFFLFSYTIIAQELPKDAIVGTTNTPELKLYPNPVFNGLVYMNTAINIEKEITIYNVFGEVVLMNKIKNNRLDVSALIPGVYLVSIREEKYSTCKKLVVK